MAAPGTTARLVAAVLRSAAAPLPDEVAAAAHRRLLGTLTAGIAGSADPLVDAIVDVWREDGTDVVVPVLGRSEQLTLLSAATANGAAAWLGLAPTAGAGGGPDATVAAGVLSLGWSEDVAGDRVLRAYALGCELETRLARALPSDEPHHFTRFGPPGPVASAVAAGIVLDLPAETVQAAVGIATAQLLGHRDSLGTPQEALAAGKGAANGLHAALLAKDGLTAPLEVLEHPRGFFAVLGLGDDRADELTDGFGAVWRWLEEDHGTDRLADTVEETVEAVLPGRSASLVAAADGLADAPSIRPLIAAASGAEVAA